MQRKNFDFEIDPTGRDNTSLSSHPATDRMSGYTSDLSDRTGSSYSQSDCGCEIDPADREKRIEELDELIHDKIGDHKYDHKYDDKYDYKNDNEIRNNLINDTDMDNLNKNVKGASCSSSDNNMNNSQSENKYDTLNSTTANNTDNIQSSKNQENEVSSCGCGGGYGLGDETDSNQYNISSNRIDDSGDDWIVERIDIWVDDTADNTLDQDQRSQPQSGINSQSQQDDLYGSNREQDNKEDLGMSCSSKSK